jgi:hypothetical protein
MPVAAAWLAVTLAMNLPQPDGAPLVGPRLRYGTVPSTPGLAYGGGALLLELHVDDTGRVTRVVPIVDTPPFTEYVATVVREWVFDPAVALLDGAPTAAEGRVLVIAMVRPPALFSSPAAGGPGIRRSDPSPGLPWPMRLTLPAYPPMARGDAVVLVEIDRHVRVAPRRRGC